MKLVRLDEFISATVSSLCKDGSDTFSAHRKKQHPYTYFVFLQWLTNSLLSV